MSGTPYLTRFRIESSREVDGQLLVSGRGLAGERIKDRLLIQPHGAASRPPPGSIGILSTMPGYRTQSMVFGVENPANRPSLPEGAKAIYDASGNIIKLMADGVTMDFGTRTVTMTGGSWNLKGNFTIDGNLSVSGDIQVGGDVTAGGSITDGDGDGGA